jgi:two-component system catabolic regulation response regulator CreB
MKILLVEDDPGIADALEYSLTAAGHEVVRSDRGRPAVALAFAAEFVVLDVGLPDMDGFDVCREVRKSSDVPVLFLTSRTEEVDRVVGLELGADDYMAKPFSTRELLARIKAIARRAAGRTTPSPGGLVLDRQAFTAGLDGRSLDLSRTEFELLACLSAHPGRVFTREQILDQAWRDGGCVTDRTVDQHIKSLRRKLAPSECIETVRGVGYRFRS